MPLLAELSSVCGTDRELQESVCSDQRRKKVEEAGARGSRPWGALCNAEFLPPESHTAWALDVFSEVYPQVEPKIAVLCGWLNVGIP